MVSVRIPEKSFWLWDHILRAACPEPHQWLWESEVQDHSPSSVDTAREHPTVSRMPECLHWPPRLHDSTSRTSSATRWKIREQTCSLLPSSLEELNKALFGIKYFGNGIKPHPGVLRLYYNGSPGLPFHSPHPSGQGRGKPQGP